jgi:glycosyltransferase involved in cell wall biosynthesis
MKLIGLIICRNETWCIEACITNALRWCDQIVVLDHASVDNTVQIIEYLMDKHPNRIVLYKETNPVWEEMRHRQKTLDIGRSLGGTHFAIIDADEMLTENLQTSIRDIIKTLKPKEILQLPWICLWRCLDKYRSDVGSVWSTAKKSMAFCDDPSLHWISNKGYDHHHTHPYNSVFVDKNIKWGNGGWFHFQFVSWERLEAKQIWYQVQEVARWDKVRANYVGTMNENGLKTTNCPNEWIAPEFSLLKPNEQPWHVNDIRDMVKKHGIKKFKTIDFRSLKEIL